MFFAFKYELPSQRCYYIVTTPVSSLNLRGIEGPVGIDGGGSVSIVVGSTGNVGRVGGPVDGATERSDTAAVCEGCGTTVAVDDNFVESLADVDEPTSVRRHTKMNSNITW